MGLVDGRWRRTRRLRRQVGPLLAWSGCWPGCWLEDARFLADRLRSVVPVRRRLN